jgi:FkbM family methyltransferase
VSGRVFTEVSVAGAPSVSFCVDPDAGDPVASWFLQHDWIDEPVQRVLLGLVEPGMRVLDLGCHLGTFALPAAALGARVLGVDAAGSHVELLNAAAVHNGFVQLHAVQRAISDSAEPVAFVERSIHGHVGLRGQDDEGGFIYVAPATVDGLLAERGWDTVELVKLDIEGLEVEALAGMRGLYARGERPTLVFECNASTLPRYGSSICELRERLVALGYELLMIDHLRPGVLVAADPFGVQPECVCDYVAIQARPAQLQERWRIEPPFTIEQTRARLLDTAAGEGAGYRAYAAEVLAHGPAWLRPQGEDGPQLRALRGDVEVTVRRAADPARASAPALEHSLAREPEHGGRPADVLVWANELTLRRRVDELERAPGDDGGPPDLLLEDACFHIRAGQLVGVVCDHADVASTLLRVLAGIERPWRGELERAAAGVLLGRIGEGLEATLTVAENIVAYAAFLGGAVGQARSRTAQVAEIAGVTDRLDATLVELDAPTIAGVALVTALEFAAPQLLLLDRLPAIASEPLRAWLLERTWQLRQAGGAIVQVLGEPAEQVGPADRMLWIAEGSIVCDGHPASVLESRWRARLGVAAAAAGTLA